MLSALDDTSAEIWLFIDDTGVDTLSFASGQGLHWRLMMYFAMNVYNTRKCKMICPLNVDVLGNQLQ